MDEQERKELLVRLLTWLGWLMLVGSLVYLVLNL